MKPDNHPDNPLELVSGHRRRLRERFQATGFDGMQPHEVLESLLINAIPRRDVKPLAKLLIAKFGSVNEVLDAESQALLAFPGLGAASVHALKSGRALLTYYLEQECRRRDLLDTPALVADFARLKIGARPRECYIAIFLDARNFLRSYEVIASGTVDRATLYKQNLASEALQRNAAKFVLAHNHPSGICTPSAEDKQITMDLVRSFNIIGIPFVDHIIVGPGGFFSFSENGLMARPVPPRRSPCHEF